MAPKKGSARKSVDLEEIPEVPDSIPRDRWGRPLIRPASGGKPIAYVRASSLGSAIEDYYNLNQWKRRTVAFGLSRRQDLLALVASVATNEGDDRAILDELCDKAHEAAEGDKGANIGTALHKLSERREAGEDLSYLPPVLLDAINAYSEQMQAFEVLATETFVACDPIQAAGTFDRVVRTKVDLIGNQRRAEGVAEVVIPAGTVLVLDLKTGKLNSAGYWGPSYSVQQTVYGCGEPYTPSGYITWEKLLGEGNRPSTDWAIILHVPGDSPKDAGLVLVDLADGAADADLCREVREVRKKKSRFTDLYPAPAAVTPAVAERVACRLCDTDAHDCPGCGRPTPHEQNDVRSGCAGCVADAPDLHLHPGVKGTDDQITLLEQIAVATSQARLDELYDGCQDIWTTFHTAAVRDRMVELAPEPVVETGQQAKTALMARIKDATSEEGLNELWQDTGGFWDDDHKRMARVRAAELAS